MLKKKKKTLQLVHLATCILSWISFSLCLSFSTLQHHHHLCAIGYLITHSSHSFWPQPLSCRGVAPPLIISATPALLSFSTMTTPPPSSSPLTVTKVPIYNIFLSLSLFILHMQLCLWKWLVIVWMCLFKTTNSNVRFEPHFIFVLFVFCPHDLTCLT